MDKQHVSKGEVLKVGHRTDHYTEQHGATVVVVNQPSLTFGCSKYSSVFMEQLRQLNKNHGLPGLFSVIYLQ